MSNGLLVYVRAIGEAEPLLSWSRRFARSLEFEEITLLHLSADVQEATELELDAPGGPDDALLAALREARASAPPPAPAEAPAPAPAAPVAAADPASAGEPAEDRPSADAPRLSYLRVPASAGLDGLIAQLRARSARLLVLGDGEGAPADIEPARKLLRLAPCAVLWLRGSGSRQSAAQRILVPIAGGPNAEAVLGLAAGMAALEQGEVHALMVEPSIGRDAEAVGRQIAERTLRRTVARHQELVHVLVAVSDDPVEAVKHTCEQGDYDLLLVGASPLSIMRRFFSKNVAERLSQAEADSTAIGVYRKAMPLHSRLGSRLDLFFREHVPQLDRQDRLELTEKIQQASEWNFDFIALVALSTVIAGLGLIRNSTAVVIGAMLIAPLMTPLVGCGLAIVQGNARLIRGAAYALALGFVQALGLGFLLGLVVSETSITSEMLARGGPNSIDLAVAIASGLAAAYATARPGLSGAVPGVAIAAALVPPIATSGIAASQGEWRLAAGAFLLFFTNIIAIVLSSAISLYAVGLRIDREQERSWQLRLWLALLVVVALLLTYLI